ncbi:hypothetical protein JAAARDRAFT_32330 [Jaapia argillacea MUCL 33604]|uniref:Tyr recombinase domain-containing protein n=1 Tax=Jaapia argillacea MUCL 33604 TaxID=933084 RepID=A0A067QFD6_9AGAM|nr:hypothetical protein JAAARDRAFT_32330 [Jaapia argillacea MUCL 33604]
MFSREFGRGVQPWMENLLLPGKFIGNPSLSVVVSQYMTSLRRRRVRAGEIVASARAIDETTLKAIYDSDSSVCPDIYQVVSRRAQKTGKEWAGKSIRAMLFLFYILSFLCLLRSDETLRIKWEWIECDTDATGNPRIKLSLPFRKTHQTGGIAPFWLYGNPKKPWLCPVRALSNWMLCNGNVPTGYVFRSKQSAKTFSLRGDKMMSSASFMECFRRHLLEVGIDPRPYGTHSFRRGGCQYLAMVLRWPIRNICSWGGWADSFDNPGTIFKYLLSLSDSPSVQREDYFNPNRSKCDPCGECGRTCWCA